MSQPSAAALPSLTAAGNPFAMRRIGAVWAVRLEWECKPPVVHPRYSYERKSTRDDAIWAAECALRLDMDVNPQVCAAHVRGPFDEDWQPVTLPEKTSRTGAPSQPAED